MKKYIALVLVLVVALSVLTGCRRNKPAETTVPTTTAPTTRPTTAPTTRPTTAPTTQPTTMPTTGPGMEDMIPGSEDTIDPSNGANNSTGITGPTNARSRQLPRG